MSGNMAITSYQFSAKQTETARTPERHRESSPTKLRLAVKLSVVIGCWAGANVIALQLIDAYEFRDACQRFHVSPQIARQFQARTLQLDTNRFPGRAQVGYKLLTPANSQSGERYPVVLYLHGAGERGEDGMQQLRSVPSWLATDQNRERFACYLIAPQCPSKAWWNHSGNSDQNHDELDILHAVLADVLKLASVDPDRIYVIGNSMGGYGTWEFACRYPGQVAAIVPIAGSGDPNKASSLVDLPIWAVHGKDDSVVPVTGSSEMIEAIRSAGGSPKYSELADVGHGALVPALKDSDAILRWLFQQSRRESNTRIQF